MNVLFVCTGNTCRSAMAEFLLKKRLETEKQLDIKVQSAGVAAGSGTSASQGAKQALKNRKLSAEAHRSQPFTIELASWADLILTMTTSHKHVLVDRFPGVSDKTFTLKEFVYENQKDMDIEDPYGGDEQIFEECANELEKAIDGLLKKLPTL